LSGVKLPEPRYFARWEMDCGILCGFAVEHQKFSTSIAVISIDGGRPWKVIPIPPSVSISANIQWAHDGRKLTYVDRRKAGDNIWSIALNGGAPEQLKSFGSGLNTR
jgi:hypothetical protein